MILEVSNLKYQYQSGKVLRFPDFKVFPGERILLVGSSGSGKSTLLNLLSGVLPLQAGTISLAGKDFSSLSSRHLDQIRADHIGIIFQSLNLIPYLSGYDNIRLGPQFSRIRKARIMNIEKESMEIAERLGLKKIDMLRSINRLSVGQQQRVAAARALLGRPELILADEPTSALDPLTTKLFLEELGSAVDLANQAILVISHDQVLEPFFDRVIHIGDSI